MQRSSERAGGARRAGRRDARRADRVGQSRGRAAKTPAASETSGRGSASNPAPASRPPNRHGSGKEPSHLTKATGTAPPIIPDEVLASDLHHEIRADLRPLAKSAADAVARRLVAAGELLDSEPLVALAHASAARKVAPRIGVVREAVGLAAYRAGEWKLAISELRAYQRISGRQTHLAVIADCERALGRPERAIDVYRSTEPRTHSPEDYIELLIVAAGARRDLGQVEAGAAMLQVPALRNGPQEPWVARLRYAYADLLIELGDEERGRQWLQRAVEADHHAETGAAERLLELDGVLLDEAEQEPDGTRE